MVQAPQAKLSCSEKSSPTNVTTSSISTCASQASQIPRACTITSASKWGCTFRKSFEREAWSFKHDGLNVEKRALEGGSHKLGRCIKTSDATRFMELYQSSLIKYWKFQPAT